MDVFKEFGTDAKKESEGVWHDVGGGGKILVARAGNRKHARLLSREVEKNQRTLDLKTDAADDVSDLIMIDVMAQTILLGWSGLKFKGADLPYSTENAKMLLGIKDFRALVSRVSNDLDNYRAAHEAEAVKS